MFTTQSRRSTRGLNGVCNRCVVSDSGLGSQEDYSGQSQAGMTIAQIANIISPPINMIPGYNQLIGFMGKMGMNVNPMSLSLAAFTGGISLLPGISDIIGGLFKKATYFGDCMKWWSDSNIIGMMGSIPPYPVTVQQVYPDACREYQLEHADSASTYKPVKNALAPAKRKDAMAAIFLSAVRANPTLMQVQCAVQSRDKGQDGISIAFNQSDVDKFWAQLREGSRQQELQNVVLELGRIMHPFQSVANQKLKAVMSTRDAALITSATSNKGYPVISKGGSLILEAGKDANTNRVITMTVRKPRIGR